MKHKSIHTLALLATAGVFFSYGPPLQASPSDADLVAAIEDTHVFKTFLKDEDITTKANGGVVTITGSVVDASHRALAEDTVAGLTGVRSVDNQLTIKPDATGANADWWTSFKVKNLLRFHRNVNASATKVNTANGIVTLTGEATSLAQKDLTTEYALDVDGVTSVQNDMTIAAVPPASPLPDRSAAEKLDDASVSAQVKTALASRRSTGSVTTKVSTRDGVVTVSGQAKNPAEKALVTKLVKDIHGVNEVVNDMTVAAATTSQK